MKLDRRLTNGLAWAGALLVVGVPVADFFIGRMSETDIARASVVDAGNSTPVVAPIASVEPAGETAPNAAVAPVKSAALDKPAVGGDAVQSYIDAGKSLPSYITGGDAGSVADKPQQSAAVPTPVQAGNPPAAVPASTPTAPVVAAVPSSAEARPPVATTPPVETVAILPPKVAPVPMPLSMRPRVAVAPQASVPQAPVLIVDEPAPVRGAPSPVITADDLEGWETGPLSDFLAQRQQQGSSAVYQVQPNENSYETEGFWLDEAPRGNRRGGGFPSAYDDDYFMPFAP